MFYPLLPDVDDMLHTIGLTALTVMKKTTLVHHISGLLPETCKDIQTLKVNMMNLESGLFMS